jgi:tRNA(Ile)-lysidine synthase
MTAGNIAHRPLITEAEYAASMAELGPFEPAPRVAAAVSGGADSMALAFLADAWARARGGALLALIVDHGLRAESADEASATVARLSSRGIATQLLRLEGLAHGTALAERARDARFTVLTQACASAGILHLLLGHHAGDQAETVLMRALGGSGPAGMAAMLPLVETASVRFLRPLLSIPPARLRATVVAAGMVWVEDPSNADRRALRPRLRILRLDHDGTGAATGALVAAAAASAHGRAEQDWQIASELAARVVLRPEGFALLPPVGLTPQALAAAIQVIAGAPFPPPTQSVASLADALKPATLAGTRLLSAGRLGEGWLLTREPAAMAPPISAVAGAVWDARFRLMRHGSLPANATLGAVGDDASRLRHASVLPAAVLRTLPAVRHGKKLLAVPHLDYPERKTCEGISLIFSPPRPAAAASCRLGDA